MVRVRDAPVAELDDPLGEPVDRALVVGTKFRSLISP